MASSLIGSLRVALSLGTADFEAGANKAASIARGKAKEIESSFAGAKRSIEGLFAAFTIGLLTEQVKKSLEYAGSLAEVSRTLGVTTKDLQTFRFAATQSGVAQDQLEVGLRRLTVSMGKAQLGSKEQAKAFAAIGISLDELKGKNTGEVFRLMADGLSKVSDRSQRAAIEMTLMGRSGSTLDNLLAPGAKRLNELAEAAQRLGIVLSDSQIQGAEETAHKLEAVKMVLSAQIAGVVANNASAILSLSSALATLTGSIIKFLGSNPQLALGIVGALLGGRVGGLPGAVIGGAAGAILGGKVAQSAADGNMDLAFRTQQMRAAQQAWAQSLSSPVAGRAIPGVGGQFAADPKAAEKEFRKQIGLLNQATALSRANSAPRAAGVTVPQIFGGGGGKSKQPKKGPTDRSDDVEFQFAQEQRQVDLQILDAKRQLSHDIGQQAEIALQSLDVEKQIKDAEIDHKVEKAKQDAAEGRITQSALAQVIADAAIEKSKEAELVGLKRQAILEDRNQALLQQSIALDSYGYDLMKSQLQKQADLAQTQSERRAIELQILDLAYKEKRIMLDRIIAESKNADEVARAQMDRRALDANYNLDRKGVIQQTQGPAAQYLSGLPTSAAKWKEALQGVAVDGFGAITNSIDPLVAKIDKLGGVFGNVTRTILSDLLKLALERRILAPLMNALFPGGSGIGAPDLGALAPVNIGGGPLPIPPGFATGGSFQIAGNRGTDQNSLALNGIPIARVSHGENVSIGTGGGGGIVINQTIAPNFAGNAATQDDLQRMFVITKAATLQAISEKHRRGS